MDSTDTMMENKLLPRWKETGASRIDGVDCKVALGACILCRVRNSVTTGQLLKACLVTGSLEGGGEGFRWPWSAEKCGLC